MNHNVPLVFEDVGAVVGVPDYGLTEKGLNDPVEWKHVEIGRHVLTGWDPPPGIYT